MPRASWRGHLRLSLVSCPVYLMPATVRTKPIRLHQVWQASPAGETASRRPRAENETSPTYARRGLIQAAKRRKNPRPVGGSSSAVIWASVNCCRRVVFGATVPLKAAILVKNNHALAEYGVMIERILISRDLLIFKINLYSSLLTNGVQVTWA
jgi:hypothetical protein